MTPIELSDHHRRALSIRLQRLERVIGIIRQLAVSAPEDQRLTHYRNPVPVAARELLEKLADELERRLAELIEALALKPTVENVTSTLNAELIGCHVNLLEAKSEALKGYGDISETLREYLDKRIEELCHLLSVGSVILSQAQARDQKAYPTNRQPEGR
jgi:hypothetical protein